MSGYDPPYPPYPPYPDPNSSHQQTPTYNAPPYDPYGGQGSVVDHSQQQQQGTAQYSDPNYYSHPPPPPSHDPFNPPTSSFPPQSDPYEDQQWAQPVPQHQQDLGQPQHYVSPLGPLHSNSFDSTTYPHTSQSHQDPFASHANLPHQQQHQDPTDDEPDSAPLLLNQQHNRWSTTTGNAPGQADPSIGLPGGFDPTLLPNQGGGGYPGGFTVDSDDQIPVQYGRIPQRQPRRYKTVKRTSNTNHFSLYFLMKVARN